MCAHNTEVALPFAGIGFARAGNGMGCPLSLGLAMEDRPTEFHIHDCTCTYM